MNDIAYILNLTTSYNASNYKYLFLPAISSGQVILFDTLTAMPIPNNKDFQKQAITDKFNKMKNHWDFFKLDPKNETRHIKVNIVLDAVNWDFLNWGEFSGFLFSKLDFIKGLIHKNWDVTELNNISFQFFITQNKDKPEEDFIHLLDQTSGIYNFTLKPQSASPSYPHWKDIMEWMREYELDINGQNIDEELSTEHLEKIHSILSSLKDRICQAMKLEEDRKMFSDYILRCYDEMMYESKNHIKKYRDYNTETILELMKNHFFKFMSSSHFLRKDKKDKDMLFRFIIDGHNTHTRIKSYESLSGFIIESISFFDNLEVMNFMTSNGAKNTITITDVRFDDDKKNHLFSIYKQLSENDSLNGLNDNKIAVKQFQFNMSIDFTQYFRINEKWENDFISINNLNSKIPAFFTYEKYYEIKHELDKNSINQIEDFIKIESEKSSQSLVAQGDYGMTNTTVQLNITEIEHRLAQLKSELKSSAIDTQVDWEKYELEKKSYEDRMPKFKESFLKELMSIPKLPESIYFILLSSLAVFVFMLPLYSFDDWMKAILIAGIFTGLMLIMGIVMRFFFIKKIRALLYDIHVENFGLIQALKNYVNALKELVQKMRISTLNRKNIDELEKSATAYRQVDQQSHIHQIFFKEIVEQIEQNGYSIHRTNHSFKKNLTHAPHLYDYQIENFSVENITIKALNFKEMTFNKNKDNLHFSLGLINQISIN